MSTPNSLMFCNAQDRPAHCKLRTNLCCGFCNQREDCLAESEVMKCNKACGPEDNTKEDPCPFAV